LGWSKEKAIEYIREQSGKHFDPKVVEAFMQEEFLHNVVFGNNSSNQGFIDR